MKDLVFESDIIIDFLNGVEGGLLALQEAAEQGVVCISAISASEVIAASSGNKRELTEKLIDSFAVVPVGKEVASIAGRYWADRNRVDFELADCVVAATVRELGAVLVTKGRRKYPGQTFEVRVVSY